MKTKVLFIGDLSRGDQANNVQTLYRLLSPAFHATRLECSAHLSALNTLTDPADWMDRWQASLIASGESPLSALDLDNSVIVGFEVPFKDLAILTQRNVPWINFEIHPIRFLEDLYLGVSSSFEYCLEPLGADPTLIELCVNALRIRYGFTQKPSQGLTLAIFGQTPIDRSVFFDSEFKRLDSYFDQLDRLANEHRQVLYRPHPYLTDTELDKKICRRYDAQLCAERDVYRLFSSDSIATVCAISSSAVVEAPFFGIRGEMLEPRAKHFGAAVSYGRLMDEHQAWVGKLLGLTEPPRCQPISRAIPKNFLRDAFGYWGYVTQEQEMEAQIAALRSTIEKVGARANLAEAELSATYHSYSWRLTRPMRWMANLIFSIFGKLP